MVQAARRQQPPLHQLMADRTVEQAVSCFKQGSGMAEDRRGPAIHNYRSVSRATVESRHIAVRIMEAHQAMHARDGLERGIHGSRETGVGTAVRLYINIGSKQRARASHDHRPLRLLWYIVMMRLTPSVRCRDDSVAPLMFLMSTFNCRGEVALFPTNCERQLASRTS